MERNKKEDEVIFRQCRFIKEEMWFFTLDDFCQARKGIKRLFKEMDKNGKLFYMWYVYASRIKWDLQNAIWDYLNFPDAEYEAELLRLLRIEKERLEKKQEKKNLKTKNCQKEKIML